MTSRQKRIALWALVVCSVGPGPDAAAQGSRGALAPGGFAITNVSLIPMSADSEIAGATVLVRDGRIVAAGASARVAVPKGVRRIDGRGKYLIPGLADMHVHLYSDDETPDSLAPDELAVMIANGVTAIDS